MRYFLRDNAFMIRGVFTALLSSPMGTMGSGGTHRISTVIASCLPGAETAEDNQSFFDGLLRKNGYDTDAVGLVLTAPAENFRVFAYDGIMVFIHAPAFGSVGAGEAPGPVTVIVSSREPFPKAGLKALLDTAAEARDQAFTAAGLPAPDPETNTILVCCEAQVESPDEEERITRAELLVSETVAYGISQICAPHENTPKRSLPFSIHSSIGGDRWTQWNPEGCPYYPCHPSCTGQRCDFCYCPLYPCGDESLGRWLERENGGKIWSCEGCTLVHEPDVADFLCLHPEASVEELKTVRRSAAGEEQKKG